MDKSYLHLFFLNMYFKCTAIIKPWGADHGDGPWGPFRLIAELGANYARKILTDTTTKEMDFDPA